MDIRENFIRIAQIQKQIEDRGCSTLDKDSVLETLSQTKLLLQILMRNHGNLPILSHSSMKPKVVVQETVREVEKPVFTEVPVWVEVPIEVVKKEVIYVRTLDEVNADDVVVMDEFDWIFNNPEESQSYEVKGNVIEEFIMNWEFNLRKSYQEQRALFLEKYHKFYKDMKKLPVDSDENTEKQRAGICDKFNEFLESIDDVVKENAFNPYFEYEFDKAVEKERKHQRLSLLGRIKAAVGEVTDDSQVRIDKHGKLYGTVIGMLGSANIKTCGAGGKNIQKFHYRTFVRKIKNENLRSME